MTGPKLLQKAELVDRSQVVYDPTPTLRKFHASNRRVRGVRGPFGCLGGDALVVTDEGLVRIDSLDRSMRVLSYDEKRDRFLFVPASVSYLKGTDALYRVRVQRGEWRAAGHHRVLCDDGVYRRVESLRPGQCVRQCSQDLRRTIGEVCESLLQDDLHSTRTAEGLLDRCGSLFHRCGQRLLEVVEGVLVHVASRLGVQGRELDLSSDTRSHLNQPSARHAMMDCPVRVEVRGRGPDHVGQALFERSAQSTQDGWQCTETEDLQGQESGLSGRSFIGSAVDGAILSIEREEVESDYWDIQVPGTNNYVTVDGVVHHNSGKSVGMCWEIFTRAQEQAPSPHDNVRRSRWVVTRNTYGELTSTTMKTWLAWFPEHRFGKVKDGSPITQMCRWGLPDGTKVELEMLFLALDRPDHLAKLLSLEITGAWMNEAREQPKAILDGLDGRIGRYPSAMDGGCTWRGIILDTNSPDDDHWWYVLAELTEDPTKKFLFLSQPAGDGPDAENLSWLDQTPDTLKHPPGSEVREARGRGYYEALKGGKTKNWIKIYVKGQYGTSEDGKPVYAEEWNDEIHIRPLVPIQGIPLQIGLDFGLTPAAVIGQTDARGRLLLLNEICGNGMAIRQFLEDALIPLLLAEYPQWYAKRQATPAMIRLWGDPAGEQPSQTDARTCFQEVKDQKFRIRAARTNDFVPRRSAVAWFLSKMAGGLPSLLVDPKCKVIRKGFNGGYKYRRIQVTGEERYTDEPMKNAYSHCFTGDTMVAMADGVDRPIAAVKVGDFVLTPDGARMVEATMFRDDVSVDELRFSNGSVLRCTPDHPFIVEGRNVRADALQYSDVLQSVGETWAVNLSASRNSSRELPTTGSRLAITSLTTARTCIAWFGRMLVDPFRPVTISITGTGTGAIMTRAIWNAFLRPTMLHTTGARDCHVEATRPRLTWSVFDQPLRVGMRRMPAALGTASTARQVGRAVRPSACNASSATSHSSDLSGLPSAGSALHRVREWLGVRVASMMSSASASFAAPPSASTSTSRQPHAVRLVGRSPSVARARVYDLTIEGAHCFYAGGILVSNCHDALQYLALECGGVQGSMARQSDLPPPPRLPAPRAMHSSTGLLGN